MSDVNYKKDFPIFTTHPDLVYLDSAASSQTPHAVIDAMDAYYKTYRANIHRGVYELSGQATEMYEAARQTVADFIGASFEEIIFTSGATQGLNLLAYTLGKNLKVGDNVVITRMEHHANLIPWQQMSQRYGFELRFIEMNQDFTLDLVSAETLIGARTKVVAFTHVSNTLGTIIPTEKLIGLAKKVGAISIVDAAQSIPHFPINVATLDCDALVFSGHKLYGPTGIGVLYGKKALLEQMDPWIFGGDMIKEVTYTSATWNDIPWKFEAGTPNIAGAIGLATAIQYVERIGYDVIEKHEQELIVYTLTELQKIAGLKIIGPDHDRVGVVSFTMEGIHPHDIASILDKYHVAVRAGHHCTMPLIQLLGIHGTTRASFGIYNSKDDVEKLIHGVQEVQKVFG